MKTSTINYFDLKDENLSFEKMSEIAIDAVTNVGYIIFQNFPIDSNGLKQTKENFLNANSSKYLFKDQINIDGVNVTITSVDNFESTNTEDINILFSTIQGLHTKLNTPRENSITFDDFTNKLLVEICSPQKIYLVEK